MAVHSGQPVKSHGENYTCPVCLKTFVRYNGLEQHISAVYWGERKHQCFVCFQSSVLQRHIIAVHEHKRDFKCQECQLKFGLKIALTAHIKRIHNETSKEYQCQTCQAKFFTRSELKKHIERVHHNKKTHQCPICMSWFKCKNNMAVHIESVHNKQQTLSVRKPFTQATLLRNTLGCILMTKTR